jgi:ATP:ADP antiporter, AAA family
MRSPRAILRSLAGIRERESGRLLVMAVYLLLIITCYTVTKVVRDSLFIVQVGPAQLPYLYVISALAMAVVSAIYPGALRRVGLYSLIRLTSLIAISNLLAFWWLIDRPVVAWFYILYVWVSLFGAITSSQAWSLATQVFDAREARRSFAWIGLGGVIGGMIGGLLAKVIAPRWGTEILLPVCVPLMAATILLLYRLTPSESPEQRNGTSRATEPRSSTASQDSTTSVTGAIWHSRYLSMLVGLLVTGVIVEAFIDYEFKWVAKSAFDSKDQLTAFLGTIAFYSGVLALLVQTTLTARFLKKFGVGYTIMLLPAAYLGCFVLVAVRPALWAVGILKVIDGSLSHSIHRSGMELLYVPIPEKQRAAVKGVIDLLVDRAGRALGGILLLVLTLGLSFSITWLSLIAAGFLAVWLVIAFFVRSDYVDAFRTALEKKVVQPETVDIRSLDLTMIQSLVRALSSDDERQVLYALELLGKTPPDYWRNSQALLLQHPSANVRCRAIALLADWRRTSSFPVEGLLQDTDMDVRTEAIRYFCLNARPGESKLSEFLDSSDYQIVLAAVQYLTRYGTPNPTLIDEKFIERALEISGEHASSARIAAARALAIVPGNRSGEFLERLLEDASPQVVQEAVRTASKLQYEPAIARLVSMLSNSRLRSAAREALLALGPRAVGELRRQLQDERIPIEVRTRIPKALSLTGTQEITDFLLGCVHNLTPRLDMPLLKALNGMRRQFPDNTFDTNQVSSLIEEESETHQDWTVTLSAIESIVTFSQHRAALMGLLEKTLKEKLDECVERTFRLLALTYSPDDVYSAFFSLTRRPTLRASAVEFLDNLLAPDLRALVVPMVESDEHKNTDVDVDEVPLSWHEILQTLRSSGDDWLVTIARELSDTTSVTYAPARIA